MNGRKMLFGLVSLCVLGAVLLSSSISTAAPAPEKKKGGRGTRVMNAESRGKTMTARMKKQLGATDDEWKAIGEKVMKVSVLSREFSRAGRGRSPARTRGKGSRPDRGDRAEKGKGAREQTALQKSVTQLRKVLANKEAKPDEITKSLAEYRKVHAKAKEELAKAQEELRKGVSVRQEAQLVLMGLLE